MKNRVNGCLSSIVIAHLSSSSMNQSVRSHITALTYRYSIPLLNLPKRLIAHLVVITEGGKKAGAVATTGYTALPLPGVDMGSFKVGDAAPDLIPALQQLVDAGCQLVIAFDQDKEKNKRVGVARSASRLAPI